MEARNLIGGEWSSTGETIVEIDPANGLPARVAWALVLAFVLARPGLAAAEDIRFECDGGKTECSWLASLASEKFKARFPPDHWKIALLSEAVGAEAKGGIAYALGGVSPRIRGAAGAEVTLWPRRKFVTFRRYTGSPAAGERTILRTGELRSVVQEIMDRCESTTDCDVFALDEGVVVDSATTPSGTAVAASCDGALPAPGCAGKIAVVVREDLTSRFPAAGWKIVGHAAYSGGAASEKGRAWLAVSGLSPRTKNDRGSEVTLFPKRWFSSFYVADEYDPPAEPGKAAEPVFLRAVAELASCARRPGCEVYLP